MKKVVFGFVLFLLPFLAMAIEPNYDVEGYFSKVEILENGSIKVREAIVLNGNFNGYERSILSTNDILDSNDKFNFENDSRYNPRDITDIKVAAFEVDELNLEMFDKSINYSMEVDYASSGEKYKYTLSDYDDRNVIRSYYSCRNCKVAFYFEYTLQDVTIIHNDIAEIYLQLFTHNYVTEDMGRILIEITLPGDDSESLMWVHGNVYGEVKRIDEDTWQITSDDFSSGSELDYRILFNKDLITTTDSLTFSSQDAITEIKEIEAVRAEEREKEIAKILAIINFCNKASIIYFIVLLIMIIFIYFKFDKEFKVDFYAKYYREFIDDYDVEVIDYLMKKKITPNAMSASIMNLVYKRKIQAELIPGSKKDYEFTLLNSEGLSEAETALVDFLFKKVGKDNKFTTKQLKKYAKSSKTYSDFTNTYTNWKRIVEKEAKSQKFFVDVNFIKAILLLYLLIGLILWGYQLSNISGYVIGHFLIIPIALAIIYTFIFSKKTKKGALHYKQWTAFKNFLDDFGTFELKELPEIALWERYLVYAVIFGLANKVQKSMNVIIKENDLSEAYSSYNTSFTDFYIYSNLVTDVSSTVKSAHELATSTAAAQYSSNSSGGGGGFSSGGGHGGGGGGGHGF